MHMYSGQMIDKHNHYMIPTWWTMLQFLQRFVRRLIYHDSVGWEPSCCWDSSQSWRLLHPQRQRHQSLGKVHDLRRTHIHLGSWCLTTPIIRLMAAALEKKITDTQSLSQRAKCLAINRVRVCCSIHIGTGSVNGSVNAIGCTVVNLPVCYIWRR